MYIEDLIEGLNDYYKQGTFFSALKKHPEEIKKQIVDFLKKKGVEGFNFNYGKHIRFNDLSQDAKGRGENFRSLLQSFFFNDEFFSASNNGSTLTFPDVVYKGKRFVINIKSNETFFEDGHDLTIKVIDKTDKYKSVDSRFKINLLNPINSVLEDLWSKIEIAESKSPDEKVVEKDVNRRKYVASDIEKTVRNYLSYSFKELKSGKKSKKELPVEFSVKFASKGKEFSSDKTTQNPRFDLNFKIKGTPATFVKSNSYSRFAEKKINPAVLEKYPDIQKWITIIDQVSDKNHQISIRQLLNDKIMNDDHELIYERLQFVAKRFLKLGYYPLSYINSYSNRDPNQIRFVYDEDLKKKTNSENLDSLFKEKAELVLSKFFEGHFRLGDKFKLRRFLIKRLIGGKSL